MPIDGLPCSQLLAKNACEQVPVAAELARRPVIGHGGRYHAWFISNLA